MFYNKRLTKKGNKRASKPFANYTNILALSSTAALI